MKIKLVDYQLKEINDRLNYADFKVFQMLCGKYDVSNVESLNSTDYEKIIEDIEHFIYVLEIEKTEQICRQNGMLLVPGLRAKMIKGNNGNR